MSVLINGTDIELLFHVGVEVSQKYSIGFILAIFILSGCNSVNFKSTQQPESLEASSQIGLLAEITSDESIIPQQIPQQIPQISTDSAESKVTDPGKIVYRPFCQMTYDDGGVCEYYIQDNFLPPSCELERGVILHLNKYVQSEGMRRKVRFLVQDLLSKTEQENLNGLDEANRIGKSCAISVRKFASMQNQKLRESEEEQWGVDTATDILKGEKYYQQVYKSSPRSSLIRNFLIYPGSAESTCRSFLLGGNFDYTYSKIDQAEQFCGSSFIPRWKNFPTAAFGIIGCTSDLHPLTIPSECYNFYNSAPELIENRNAANTSLPNFLPVSIGADLNVSAK